MPKKKGSEEVTADSMPTSVTELKPLVDEFMKKYKTIKQEQELLKNQEKELFEEYKTKIDIKELKAAMKVAAIMEKISHKDAFDTILECIEND
jgi:hypothetical protein